MSKSYDPNFNKQPNLTVPGFLPSIVLPSTGTYKINQTFIIFLFKSPEMLP